MGIANITIADRKKCMSATEWRAPSNESHDPSVGEDADTSPASLGRK
jgi:hypothetical protein